MESCSLESPIAASKKIQIPITDPKTPKGKLILILETISQCPVPSNHSAISSALQIIESMKERTVYTEIQPKNIIDDHEPLCFCQAYHTWSFQCRMLLSEKQVWKVVNGQRLRPTYIETMTGAGGSEITLTTVQKNKQLKEIDE